MAKMYYTEDEAVEKLGVSAEELKKMVEQAKLRVYSDGARRMYKASEVDEYAPQRPGESGEIELTPADSAVPDAMPLSQADKPPAEPTKEDTVITSEGISIFDDEDLEIEAGDPMAKTTVTPSVEEQISLEGVGSGSGLLDLTRESDDTSLGAEVLEHIDVESSVPSSVAGEAIAEEPAYTEPEAAVVEAPTVVEEIDPAAGAFSGLALAATLIMLLVEAVMLPVMMEKEPPYLAALRNNLLVVLGVSAIVSVVLAFAGYLIGKSIADRAAALQRGEQAPGG